MNGNPLPFTMQQPLQCERAAAKIFGADCAIILQRFVWWTCPANGRSKIGSLDDDGYKWVYFTLDELEAEFDWLSRSTIRRIIGLLEDNHLLISKQPEGWASRRKHYSVRWPMWLKVQSGEFCGIDDSGKLIPSVQNDHAQNEQMADVQIEHVAGAQNEQFLTNCNVLRPLTEKSDANDQPGILAGRYPVPDEQDLKAERDSQAVSLKAAPSPKAEGAPSSAAPRKPSSPWEVAYGVEMPESLRTENCLAAVRLWLQHMTERRKSYKPTGLKMALSKWSNQFTAASFPMAVEDSIAANYAGIFPSKPQQQFQPSAPKPKPVWLQIKELEARIESHVANHNRLGYDSSKSTPEAKEEWRRMKQTLKDLQAGQPQADEGVIP